MKDYRYFYPEKTASWWTVLDDIQWPQKTVRDRIKYRAEGFAKAGIDTAINFGFHIRFDFSNYFGSLHGYFADVCNELHKYDIKFMDHYSCNTMERPKNKEEYFKLHASHRHHVLLHHDPVAAEHAQYEGYLFNDLCERDVRDNSRGYSLNYQCELFCHNNPDFLDMHVKYLKRLLSEAPIDGFQIDDMTDYGYLSTCGCNFCTNRLKKDYGHDLPSFEDKSFWGNTDDHPSRWGNYNNPVFRDWLRMKTDSITDHMGIIKKTIGDLPLMTCCSSTGPIALNAVSLDMEKYVPHLDLVMLENCGLGTSTVNWARMDAEALQQKDIAEKMGNAPAIALSYTIYEDGGYLGWSLSRFWGVSNWCSTLPGRLTQDPEDAMQTHNIVMQYNTWEEKFSNLSPKSGRDVPEARLVSNRYCRENGWRDPKGHEHWDKVSSWSKKLVESNIGYRFLRAFELEDANLLLAESTPLILDGLGCVSDAQFAAISKYLESGGKAFISLPFGTHDEKGFLRDTALSDLLNDNTYSNLLIIDSITEGLDISNLIVPRIKKISGSGRRALRLRVHNGKAVVHIVNMNLRAVPHPYVKTAYNDSDVLARIESDNNDDEYIYEIDLGGLKVSWNKVFLMSPETSDEKRPVVLEKLKDNKYRLSFSLKDNKIYSVIQE